MWTGKAEKTLDVRSDKKSKHASGGSVNTVDFSAVPATSPQRKGTTSKRVQINDPPVSSDTMNGDEDDTSQEGASIQSSRLFDTDLGFA